MARRFGGRGGLQKSSWPRLLLADFRIFYV